MARKTRRLKPAPIVPPPSSEPVPLPLDLLTAPQQFGAKIVRADTQWWQYWQAVVVTALLAGLSYALLMRPGVNLAAAEALRVAGQPEAVTPPIFSHITNTFGSFFLSMLTFVVMWGLGRLGAGKGKTPRGAKVAEIYSASFALLIPLYLLVMVLTLVTPGSAWTLNPDEVTKANGNLLKLQSAGLHNASQTPAALAFIIASVLGTVAQFGLAFPALRATTEQTGRAALGVLLPLVPALLVQFIGIAPMLFSR